MFANTSLNGDFTLSSVFGRYEFEGARTKFTGELGLSIVDQSSTNGTQVSQLPLPPGSVSGATPISIQAAPGGTLTEPMARLQLTRRLSASTRLIFTGGRILTDPASSFGAQSVGATGIPVTAPGYLSGGVYRETYVSAGWQFQRNRTTVGVTGRWERDVYPGLPSLDSVTPSAQLNLQRRMSRAWTLQFWSNWNQGHYPNAVLSQQIVGSTEYDNASVGGSFIWHHGRGLEVRLRVEHDSYTVSNGNTGYHDNRAFLTIGYRPGDATPAEQAY